MTIDERLEALTYSVELLAQMHSDNERKYQQRFERNEALIERIVAVQETLGAIASDHSERIKRLES